MGGSTPFQIDANFGLPAGLLEAVVQSHEWVKLPSGGVEHVHGNGEGSSLEPAFTGDRNKAPLVRLLPALPAQWASAGGPGSAKGLTARGGFVVDVSWDKNAKLQSAHIKSKIGGPVCITSGTHVIGRAGAATGGSISIAGAGSGEFVCMQTKAGHTYVVTPR